MPVTYQGNKWMGDAKDIWYNRASGGDQNVEDFLRGNKPAAPQPTAGAAGAAAFGAGGDSGGGGLDLTGSQAVQSIQQAAGPLPGPPVSPQGQNTAFIDGAPGQMRPGLATRRPPPDDGGLRGLQRRIY